MTDRRTFIKQLGSLGILAILPATAKSKEISVRITPNVIEDLKYFHGIDVEDELARIISEEVQREIDFETIHRMIKTAPTQMDENTLSGYKVLKFYR